MSAPFRSLLEAALTHAERGRPVFPCGPDKAPRTPRGHLDATTAAAPILSWWSRGPRDLIGMPTGARSGLVVLDLDTRGGRDGVVAFERLRAGRDLPDTLTVRTRSGGRHHYFDAPADRAVRCSAGRLAPGVDVRGDGGYVVVPPSEGYAVVGCTAPAPLPAWLLALLAPPPPPPGPPRSDPAELGPAARKEAAERRFGAILRVVRAAPPGTRHDRLYWAACRAGEMTVAGGLDEGAAAGALVAAAMEAGGEDERNARNTARDGIRRGKEEAPRAG